MPRAFNIEVFNQVIGGADPSPPMYYTNEEHASLIGGVDFSVVQVIIDSVTTAPTKVTVQAETNNTLEAGCWVSLGTNGKVEPEVGSLTGVPYAEILGLEGTASYVRFAISSTEPGVSVRVIVAGYTR